MNDNLQIAIAIFKNKTDTFPQNRREPWSQLRKRLTSHAVRREKDGSLWSPTAYPPSKTRKNENVEAVTMAVGDIDHGMPFEELAPMLGQYEYVAYSTHSHTPDHPRYRIVIPLTRPVPAVEWPDYGSRIREHVFGQAVDEATKDASRVYYLPSCPPETREARFVVHHQGQVLDPDSLPPASNPVTPVNGHAGTEGSMAKVPLGKEALHFVANGAPIGEQRMRALKAGRNYLSAGYSEAETIEAIWRGLQASPQDNANPWTKEQVFDMVLDLASKPAPPLRDLPPLLERNSAPAVTSSFELQPAQANRWPDALAPTAYHGLAGDMVRSIEPHTEADPAAIMLQFLIAYGNAVGRGPYFQVEADRHGLNEYGALVGNTSKGRKGTSWGHVRNPFGTVDPDWETQRIQSGLSSGEGLIWAVRDPITRTEPIKEKGRPTGEYQDIVSDPGVSDKRLLVLEDEFASTLKVLGREGNTLSPVIRRAWDNGSLRALTKNSPAQATGAHVSVVAHITRDELRRYLDNTEAGNGFANRFLWLCVRRSKCLPEGGRMGEVDFAPLVRRLRQAVDFGKTARELKRDETARSMWREVYPELSEGKPGLLGAVTSRAEAHVTRLSCIYALLDMSYVVGTKHLLAALALWEYCEASARYIFGDSLGDPDADQLLAALRAAPEGMTRSEISRGFFSRNKSAPAIERMLQVLAEHNLARRVIEKTDGRDAERWYAVTRVTTLTTETTKAPPDEALMSSMSSMSSGR